MFKTHKIAVIACFALALLACGETKNKQVIVKEGSVSDAQRAGLVSDESADMQFTQAHMYVMPPGQTRAAVYLRLQNHSKKVKTLLHAHSLLAGSTEVHHTVHEDGMMQMRKVNQLKVNAGETLEFKPGELHLMLLDVAEVPKAGDQIIVNLEFDDGSYQVPVDVLSVN